MRDEDLRRNDECRSRRTVPALPRNILAAHSETRHTPSFVSSATCSSQEIVMTSSRTTHPSRFAFATVSAIVALLSAGHALASQGPGGGPGTASSSTQLAMAIIVYGTAALAVGIGLIGVARRR
jgi:hypothetical protein